MRAPSLTVVLVVLLTVVTTSPASGYSARTDTALDVAMHHWQSRAAATGMHVCGESISSTAQPRIADAG